MNRSPNLAKGGSPTCRLTFPNAAFLQDSPSCSFSTRQPVAEVATPMNYLFINPEADRVEEMIPSMSYATLVENLGWMTELGVIAEESPTTMLVVARLVDRGRVLRSGLTASQLRQAADL